VSKKFWLYWAITAPLTLCTLIIWALANYKGVTKQHFKAFMQLSKGAGKVDRD
jgi:hypothetical protein